MNLAVIIARGGSKRLPRKNLRPFCGVPLVAWAIIQARCSKSIDGVFVSTDDDEIEAVSRSYGAQVIRRPDWPDADQVAANRVFCHAIKVLKEKYGKTFTSMVGMLPTTPLIRPDDLDRGFSEFKRLGRERILSLIRLREAVVYKQINTNLVRLTVLDKSGNNWDQGPAWSICNPDWYLTSFDNFPDTDKFLNDIDNQPLTELSFIPAEYWQYADVDTIEEFEFAEIVMEHYILMGRGVKAYEEYRDSHSPDYDVDTLQLKMFGNSNQLGGE